MTGSLVVTLAPTTTQLYPGLYLSPGERYLRSVKGKNYFYDVGNPLRFFFSTPFNFFFQPFILIFLVGLGQVGRVGLVDPLTQPVNLSTQPVDLLTQPVDPSTQPVNPTRQPVNPTRQPVNPTCQPINPTC